MKITQICSPLWIKALLTQSSMIITGHSLERLLQIENWSLVKMYVLVIIRYRVQFEINLLSSVGRSELVDFEKHTNSNPNWTRNCLITLLITYSKKHDVTNGSKNKCSQNYTYSPRKGNTSALQRTLTLSPRSCWRSQPLQNFPYLNIFGMYRTRKKLLLDYLFPAFNYLFLKCVTLKLQFTRLELRFVFSCIK